MPIMNRSILRIALPSIVSNITVPLVGLVDTAITGHLGNALYLTAIAIGTSVFNAVYWIFNFLRTGTGGLTAQAYGAGNTTACKLLLLRSLLLSVGLGTLVFALQVPLFRLALWSMESSLQVEALSLAYARVLAWGFVPSFCLFALLGWLIGMQNAKIPMIVALVQNLSNVAFSLFFVQVLQLHLDGVALGTVFSQYLSLGFTVLLTWRWMHQQGLGSLPLHSPDLLPLSAQTLGRWERYKGVWNTLLHSREVSWKRFFMVNRNLFLRTLLLVSVMFSFTRFGTHHGEHFVAVCTLLFQLFTMVSYIMDGFAYAGEAIGGKLYGANQVHALRRLTRFVLLWGLGLALLFSLGYGLGGQTIVALLTNETAIRELARHYLPYAVCIPLVSMAAFIFDGLCIGLTATRTMLIALLWASVVFYLLYWLLRPFTNEHALWWAFLAYLGVRGLVQGTLFWRSLPKNA